MATSKFDEGIEITLPEDLHVTSLQAPATRRSRKLNTSGSVPMPTNSGETHNNDLILDSLEKSGMELMREVEIEPVPQSGTRRMRSASASSTAEFNVDLAQSEEAVILLEQDGMYLWKYASEARIIPSMRRRGAGLETTQKRVVFLVEIASPAETDTDERHRSILGKVKDFAWGKVKVYVLKFVAGATVELARKRLEKNVSRGIVHIKSASPGEWQVISGLQELKLPTDRAPKIFLFVHGTFSSTVGAFGIFGGTPWGKSFLDSALKTYDAVIGFNHATLSEDPLQNAQQLLDAFQDTSWVIPPQLDVIAHSRGGLVIRCLIEKLLPQTDFQATFNKVIFVACTNGGTLLAEPANWESLVNLYTNLAAGACRVIGLISPQSKIVTLVLDDVIQSIGSFIKFCADSAITDRLIPGLSAMEPDGEFIKDINLSQTNQPTIENSYYCAITSVFKPRLTGEHEPHELPKRFLSLLRGKFIGQLMKEANDLVVDTESMSTIDLQIGNFIKERYDFEENPQVYHTNYFTRPEVANALVRWLRLAPVQPGEKKDGGMESERKTRSTKGAETYTVQPPSPITPLPAGVAGNIILPPVVDTDIITINATASVESLKAEIAKNAPSYVVVRRSYQGQDLNYAFKGEEAFKIINTQNNTSVTDAFNLHEYDASGTQKVGEDFKMKEHKRGMLTTSRNVILMDNIPVGVVPEKKEVPGALDLAVMAQMVLNPGNDEERMAVRRSMPTFTESVEADYSPETASEESPTTVTLGNPSRRGWRTRMEDLLEVITDTEESPSPASVGIPSPAPEPRSASVGNPTFGSSNPLAGSIFPGGLKSPTASKVTCYFRAEMDAEVVIKRATTVAVTISREILEKIHNAGSATANAKVSLEKKILIRVIAKSNFIVDDESDGRTEIDVPPLNQPQELYFDLRATEEGEGEIWVLIRQAQMSVAKLILKPKVVISRSLTAEKVTAERITSDPKPLYKPLHQLGIEEYKTEEGFIYKYDIYSEGLKIKRQFKSKPILGNRENYVANLYKQIEDRWISSGKDEDNFAQELRAFGADLFDELIPAEMQKILWERRKDFDSIQVESSEPFIPWELVHLRDPDENGMPDETLFLAQMGLIRWLEGAGKDGWPPDKIKIRKGSVRYVIPKYPHPDYKLPEAEKEEEFLKEQFAAIAVDPESGEVRNMISKPGKFDLLHFACHGVAESGSINEASLLMQGRVEDEKYVIDSLSATVTAKFSNLQSKDNDPMVVLNACQAGRAGYKLTGIGGFANAFLSGGAGAFIGTLWSVGDSPARTFTETLYTTLTDKGKNLSEATIEARNAAKKAGEATWLAYVVYGHPHLRIIQ